jgi:hypothetical protein
MAYIYRDKHYVPVGFLIVRDGADPYSTIPGDTRVVDTDWDYPGVASRMGFVPCDCGATDGTVDCPHKTATEMITAAANHIDDHEGESFPELDEYLNES